jgi:hypothetical protein
MQKRRLEEQRDSSRGMQESIEMENQVRKSKIHFNIAYYIYKAIVVPFTDMRLPRSAEILLTHCLLRKYYSQSF